jgi:hypothetical protein
MFGNNAAGRSSWARTCSRRQALAARSSPPVACTAKAAERRRSRPFQHAAREHAIAGDEHPGGGQPLLLAGQQRRGGQRAIEPVPPAIDGETQVDRLDRADPALGVATPTCPAALAPHLQRDGQAEPDQPREHPVGRAARGRVQIEAVAIRLDVEAHAQPIAALDQRIEVEQRPPRANVDPPRQPARPFATQHRPGQHQPAHRQPIDADVEAGQHRPAAPPWPCAWCMEQRRLRDVEPPHVQAVR